MNLIQLSISGSAAILFALSIRIVFFRYLPKNTFFTLWIVAAFRLLLPVSISLPAYIPLRQTVFTQESIPLSIGKAVPTLLTQRSHQDLFPLLSALWLAGVLLLAVYFLRAYWRGMRIFRFSLPDQTSEVQIWLTEHPLHRPLAVRRCDRISSPLTYGILRPVILLPKGWTGTAQSLNYVLTHEYVHVRRFDAAFKLLFAAALCLHWFNPLVWILYRMGNRDMELSCDAGVLKRMGNHTRAEYAHTLLDSEEVRSSFSTVYSYFRQNSITERIESIMKYKKSSSAAVILALTLVVGATAAFASAPTQIPQDAPALKGILCDNENPPYHHAINVEEAPSDSSWEVEPVQELTAPQIFTQGETADDSSMEEMPTTLISVSHDDESKFTPEEWASILEQIDQGNIVWED